MELLWALEGIRSPFLDTLFGWITRLGEEMILIVIVCVFFWCVNKRVAYVMGVTFFLSSLAVQGLKVAFRVPRPWVADPSFNPVEGAVGEATGYSFPSGHTQNAAAILGSLGAQTKRRAITIVLFTLAILVAFSRMYLGVHYLSDVLASLAITFLILWFVMKLIPEEPGNKKRELLIALVLIICALAVIVLAIVMYHSGIVAPSHLRDSTRSAGAAIAFAIGMYVERMYIRFSVKAKLPMQVVKVVLGLAGTLALQEGVRFLGTGLVIDAVRYFLMVLWIVLFYPLIIKRFFARQ